MNERDRTALLRALPGALARADGLGWDSDDFSDPETLEVVANQLAPATGQPVAHLMAALPGVFQLAEQLGWDSDDFSDPNTLEALVDHLLGRSREPSGRPVWHTDPGGD